MKRVVLGGLAATMLAATGMTVQGSSHRARTSPSENEALSLAGIVSRFFASSECSKVPWNAKAHAV